MLININEHQILIDEEDYQKFFVELMYKYNAGKTLGGKVYVKRNLTINGKNTVRYLHRDIMGITNSKVQVDHINGDGLDNRKSNLRLATPKENGYNRRANVMSGDSRYKGVTRRKDRTNCSKPWKARIGVDGDRIAIGYYATEKEAAMAYNEAALKYHREFARLNEVAND